MCSTVIVVILLMMAAKVRTECDRPFLGENRILTNESDQLTFPGGATLKFKCSRGYVPAETSVSRSITCNGTDWSELQLQCEKRSCGNPGDIINGKYLYQPTDGVLFGAVITAECNNGFQLVGPQTRLCKELGWDVRPPVCEPVICKKPVSIVNGVFEPEKDSYEYGEGVTYSCNRGFDLFGEPVLTCSTNGTFQPAVPQCLSVSCGKPEIPNAEKTEGKSPPYKFKQFVRYKCNEGYKMEGSDFLICTEKGWDPALPRCNEVTCDEPQITDAFIFEGKASSYKHKSTIQVKCSTGYRMEGSAFLSCGNNGWNPVPPKCRRVTCSPPQSVNNGQVKPPKEVYDYGETVTYSCNDGYKLHGASTISCSDDGRFPHPPQCLTVVTCSPPPSVNNGQVKPLKEVYDYGETVTYSCNDGYKLHGASTISCSDDGRFPRPPQCLTVVTCDEPNIINGFVVNKNSRSVLVQCNSGYGMTGSDYLTCKENGWDPPPPHCHLKYWIWILSGLALCAGVVGACCCCQKKKQISECISPKKNSDHDGKPDHCALVSMNSSPSPAQETLLNMN